MNGQKDRLENKKFKMKGDKVDWNKTESFCDDRQFKQKERNLWK